MKAFHQSHKCSTICYHLIVKCDENLLFQPHTATKNLSNSAFTAALWADKEIKPT